MTTTATTSLTAFLLARIEDDEAAARAAWPERWEQDGDRNAVRTAETGLRGGYEGLHMGVAHCAMTVGNYQAEARNAAHIARHDPARVLAECEAKRRIVEEHPDYGGYGETCATCQRYDDLTGDPWPCPTLRALAAVYADHEDFQPEWRA